MEHQDFWDFYQASYRQVTATVFAHCGNRADAEDLAQSAYFDCLKSWTKVRGYENPSGWVIGAAIRRSISMHRRRQVAILALSRFGLRERCSQTDVELRLDLLKLIRDLPERQRAAVVLYYLGDQSVESVATILGVGVGTVKQHLSRARTTLAQALGEVGDDAQSRRA